jgi:rhodanese-related sulfurtransferase
MMAFLMGLRNISPREVLQHVEAHSAIVFDVNALGHWCQSHVPRSTNLEASTFAASALPVERETLLVFYCSGPLCRKAPNAALRARRFGYSNVRVMSAGIQGWRSAGLPVESAPDGH